MFKGLRSKVVFFITMWVLYHSGNLENDIDMKTIIVLQIRERCDVMTVHNNWSAALHVAKNFLKRNEKNYSTA